MTARTNVFWFLISHDRSLPLPLKEVVQGPVASLTFGNLLEIQVLEPYPKPPKSEYAF